MGDTMDISDLCNNHCNSNEKLTNQPPYLIVPNQNGNIVHIHLSDGTAIEIRGRKAYEAVQKQGAEFYIAAAKNYHH